MTIWQLKVIIAYCNLVYPGAKEHTNQTVPNLFGVIRKK